MRKKTLSLLIILSAIITFAQSPNSFKYQTVVRDFSGNIMENHNVSFQFSILQGSATGTAVYTETHAVTTNEFGLVNLNIGGGSTSDDFSSIDWGNGPFFIKVELDENGGTAYAEMGTSQLLSVPYAMYANDVANKDDDDADPFNEFQTITKLGNTVTLSDGGGSFIDEVDDADNSATNELQILNFSNDTLYLDNGGQVYLGEYSSLWGQNDTNIFYNNGWVGVGTETPSGMMVVQGDEGVNPDSAIFEVKNKNGQTIFAVYDGGVRIWVDDTDAKINTDKGGFAVGGYRLNKSTTNEYLRVTPDSVRVYIREDDGAKINTDKGGFAVGGYRLNKSTTNQYFNINANLEADTLNPSEARIFWYPLKEAFMSGRVLVESADSVGQNSWATGFESKSIGDYSQAMGYKARAFGNNSTAIGNNANAINDNSYAFGNNTYVENINSYAIGNGANVLGKGSYAIGSGAQASGNYSFAVGSDGVDSAGIATNPTIATGDYSYAFGMGSVANNKGAIAFGIQDTASGYYSLAMGYRTKSSGYYTTSLGYKTKAEHQYSTAIGELTIASGGVAFASGYKSVASGEVSLAMGRETKSTGWASTSLGDKTYASGLASTAIGKETYAEGRASTAMGFKTITKGVYSTAAGEKTIALGNCTYALGIGAVAKSYYSLAIGRYNDTLSNSNMYYYASSDPVFIIGDGSDENHRHNSLTVLKNGDMFLTKSGNNLDNLRFRVSGSAYDIDFYNHNLYFSGYNGDTQLVAMMIEYDTGNVGIGTSSPDKKLTVDGNARITGSIFYGVNGSTTVYAKPDFVFMPNYEENYGIFEIEEFINKNGHLPWLTAAKDEKDGVNMTKMSFQTLEAVENQQLQIIELKKEKDQEIKALKKENKKQQEVINELIKRIEKLETKN